ncbi:hypothetical protein [Brachybacterium sp. ACRRE]|uniref:hypothetical protein n=1 Tax=Brachybacterium sp. ACRRE TaxID=2918184 RepID=UPI001EF36363|nr:hypothetical protein [Brachybacterium sp. ACRRE]MCG7308565.1 hypothetical protein [Brachybacterium sp. ACRRE]
MTPKRSDDPAAREREEHAPAPSDYWDEERRHAAIPAEIRIDPTSRRTDSEESESDCDASEESPEPSRGNADTGRGGSL